MYYRQCYTDKIKLIEQHQSGIIWIKILGDLFTHDQDIFLCHVYIPPASSKLRKNEDFDFYETLENGIINYKLQGKVLITGDFNGRSSNLSDLLDYDKYLDDEQDFSTYYDLQLRPRVNSDHVVDSSGRRLLLLCQMSNLIIANGRLHHDADTGYFTYCSHAGLSVVDYLLLHPFDVQIITDFKVLEFTEFSDHAPLFFTFQLKHTSCNITNPVIQDQQSTERLSNQIRFDDEKIPLFRAQLMNNNETLTRLTGLVNTGPVDSILKSFTTFMYDKNIEQVFGTKDLNASSHRKHKIKPQSEWFNNECRAAKSEFKTARNIFLRTKNDENRKMFVKTRTKFNRVKRKAKVKFKQSEGKNVCNLAKSNPKKIWKSIKKRFKKKSPQSDTLNAQNFYQHFKEIYGGIDEQAQQNEQQDLGNNENDELDSEITDSELKEAIFSQKNGKSCGLDNLCTELFKNSYDIISPFLLKLFNRLFANGEYPKAWGEGIIVPIFKSGNPDDAQNYRGITLINILGKVYSQVLLNRLSKWSEKYDKLSKNQFGFQKGKSTVDCIFLLNSIVSKVIHSGEKLYCCFIDYEKAFDRIDRSLLWHKLIFENVSSKFVRALKSMYDVVRACVRYNSSRSNFFNSQTGLKQGDPSSPLLFMMFINDLIDNINADLDKIFKIEELSLFMVLYADDAVVFAKSK